MARDVTLTIPDLRSFPSRRGGFRFYAGGDGRSFVGVVRRIPGRLVYEMYKAGERSGKGWTAIDSTDDLREKIADILLWVAAAPIVTACSEIAGTMELRP